MSKSISKKTIAYAFDPLCGWCYGISSVLRNVIDAYPDKIDLEIKLGGLFILEAAKPYNEFKRHLNNAKIRLEEVTGKTLGDKFLQNILGSQSLANSSTPNQFLLELKNSGLVDSMTLLTIIEQLQYYHYQLGLDFNKREIYQKALNKNNIDNFEFNLNLDPMDITEDLMEEYRSTRDLGGYGFPAFFVKKGNNFKHISHSYNEDDFLDTIKNLS